MSNPNALVWQGKESRLIRCPRGGWIVETLAQDALGLLYWREAEFIREIPGEMWERISTEPG